MKSTVFITLALIAFILTNMTRNRTDAPIIMDDTRTVELATEGYTYVEMEITDPNVLQEN